MSELFPSDLERDARNAAMTAVIAAGAYRGERTGTLAALARTPSTADGGEADAQASAERSRATEQPRDPETGRFAAGFDGGVRGHRPRPTPGMAQPSSVELLAASLEASRAERALRDAEPERPIFPVNVSARRPHP